MIVADLGVDPLGSGRCCSQIHLTAPNRVERIILVCIWHMSREISCHSQKRGLGIGDAVTASPPRQISSTSLHSLSTGRWARTIAVS